MARPSGIAVRTCTIGVGFGQESNADLGATITVKSSEPELVWAATGSPGVSDPVTITIEPGAEASFDLIPTDLTGWLKNGAPVDVSDGRQSHYYTITVQWTKPDSFGRPKPVGPAMVYNRVVVPSGSTPLDLDTVVQWTGATGQTISLPAELTTAVTDAQTYAAQAATSAQQAHDLSQIDTSDGVVTALVADGGSATTTQLKASVAGYISDPNPDPATNPVPGALDTRVATNVGIYQSDADQAATGLWGLGYYQIGDSFENPVNSATPAGQLLATQYNLTFASQAVAGHQAQDQVVAATSAVGATSPENSIVAIKVGMNDQYHYGEGTNTTYDRAGATSAQLMDASADSLLTLLCLAATRRRVEQTDPGWTYTGGWSDYSGGGSEVLSGGSAKLTTGVGDTATWVVDQAGVYVALGHNASADLGQTFHTGQWQVNGRIVYADRGDGYRTDVGSQWTPRPIPLGYLRPGDQVTLTVTGAGFTYVDVLLHLTDDRLPPWITLRLPTPILAGGDYVLPDETNRQWRRLWLSTAIRFTAMYPLARGRLVILDPAAWGWSVTTMTDPDHLHPNQVGQDWLAQIEANALIAAQRQWLRENTPGLEPAL